MASETRESIEATPRNMRAAELRGERPVMLCTVCGETYSATSGDYFWQPEDKPLTCCEEPCVLARRIPERFEVMS